MILLIDNYDSFTYNLKQELEVLGVDCRVHRNDALTVAEILALAPQAIVLSPGPGAPASAGICLELIRTLCGQVPILGVCLGHQAIAEALGGKVRHARVPMHGKTSAITHNQEGVFRDLPSPVRVARYHSLIVEGDSLPAELRVTARSEDGEVMGILHANGQVEGVQFHPESIATEAGQAMLSNFLVRCARVAS